MFSGSPLLLPRFPVTNKIRFTGFRVTASYSNSTCNEVKEVGRAPGSPKEPSARVWFPNTADCGPKVTVKASSKLGTPQFSCSLTTTIPVTPSNLNLYIRPDHKGPFFGCIITKYNFEQYL